MSRVSRLRHITYNPAKSKAPAVTAAEAREIERFSPQLRHQMSLISFVIITIEIFF